MGRFIGNTGTTSRNNTQKQHTKLIKILKIRFHLYQIQTSHFSSQSFAGGGTFLLASMTSILIALIATPALLATSEAIRQGQSKDRKEEHRARRSNLVISYVDSSPLSFDIDHRQVALRNNKVTSISARKTQSVMTVLFSYMQEPIPKMPVCTPLRGTTFHIQNVATKVLFPPLRMKLRS
jgi:hypothetical protein